MNYLSKLYILIFLVLISFSGNAQKEANIWYFGENAGLDFNSGVPVALTDGQLNTLEGCASIADNTGNLLFYSDGITVWNKSHAVMQNGTGLLGDPSSTHSALIVPKPESAGVYYIFTVDAYAEPNGLNYSEVDISLDNGLGAITSIKNIQLEAPTPEKISAIKHANNVDYWVVSHKWESDEFISYKITKNGVDPIPVISKIGSYIGETLGRAPGAIKISPDGKKLAVANAYSWGDNRSNVEVFDFDTTTGKLSNPIVVDSNDDYNASINFRGIEFSPDSKLLYYSKSHYLTYPIEENTIYQVNLSTGDEIAIRNSRALIYQSKERATIILQQATDGKIYITVSNNEYLDVINNPNSTGIGCNYQINGVYLGGRKGTIGLPPFIQSFFNVGILFEDTCLADTTSFKLSNTVDSAIWDFGDPSSGANNTSTDIQPTHVFSAPGTYEVSVTATVGTETATETISVTIYEQPMVVNPPDYMLCDYDGGRTFFLDSYSSFVLGTLDPDIFGVNYYEGMDNYNIGIKIPIPNAYVGPTDFFVQQIIAEVYNKQNPACNTITSFNVGLDRIPKLKPKEEIPNLVLCDDVDSGSDTDGRSVFDLTQWEGSLLAEPMANVDYFYYLDEALQQPIASPEAYTNTQNPLVIFVEGVNRDTGYCRDVSSFVLEVISLPQVNALVTLKQCDDNLDGFSAFNLNEVVTKITSNAANETVSFFESQWDAENNNNPISNPITYINQTDSSDTVWARVENANGCYRLSQVDLVVSTTQIPNTYTRDFYRCDADLDGIATFDFSSVNLEIQNVFPIGQQLLITYYRNEADALAEINQITDISDYQNIGYPNSQQIYVRVDSEINNDCLGLGAHINLYVEPQPTANPVTIPRECDDDNDGLFSFDVSQIQTNVLNGQSLADVTVAYFDGNNNPLSSPLPNPFVTSSQTITIRVSNNNVADGSCYDEITLDFIVDKQPIANPVQNQIACDDGVDDADGLHEFDTSLIESTILNGQTGMEVHYFDGNGIQLTSPLPNPFLSGSQTITVNVVNPLNTSCYATASFDLIVNLLPKFSVETPLIVCSSDPTFTVVLDPMEEDPSEVFDYEWTYEDGTILSHDPTITVSTPGTYTITLTKTDGTGCSRTRDIFVNSSELATITLNDITIVDNTDSNSISINTLNLGLGDYEFALNNEFALYQDSPYFSNVSSGIHTLYVRDKKGCGTSSIEISLIGYPKYFTPNGDGFNDYWYIKGVNDMFQAQSDIYIYDRYGKLLTQLATTSNGWDGTFNGSMMPADDYWFSVFLEDGREFKGHFALKR